jgi:NTP pyrophosphatase (non-canonical NTP hydrolase)
MLTEQDLKILGYFDMVDVTTKPKTMYEMVREFHNKFCPDMNNGDWSEDVMQTRFRLIQEEFDEVVNAWNDEIHEGYEEDVVKELIDLLYVTFGTLAYLGADADEAFRRVHESNMSKLGEDGKPIRRADGKVLKGPNYKEADLRGCV